jgi:2-deoxy-D-gluconate 3-dehydrogenase
LKGDVKMARKLTDFTMDCFSLKGKIAMITGANQNLGMAYAVALATAGADLFIPHFTPDVSEIKDIVEGMGCKVAFLQGDLTDENHRREAVKACVDAYGRIDILINNAGVNYTAPLLDFPDDKWKMVVDLQLNAAHYLSREAAKVMVKTGGGKIINIASALSFYADKNATAYTVAKHGIIGLTRSFAVELGKYNISCNAIAPGFYKTEINRTIREELPDMAKKVSDHIPLGDGDWGDIFHLMGTAVFLSSSASDYISGWVVNVDGGFSAQMI